MSVKSTSISHLTDPQLFCRDKGHAWAHKHDTITSSSKAGEIRQITREFACPRCTTKSHETMLIPSCEIVGRRYEYPDGYLLALGHGQRANVAEIRREEIGRMGIVSSKPEPKTRTKAPRAKQPEKLAS